MPLAWVTEKRKISDLKPAEYNPRQATEKECNDLRTSIERFNLADPIIINKNNTVIGGHFRLKILKEKYAPDQEIDVRVPDRELTLKEEQELNLRLNKNTGSFDFDMLANLDTDLLIDVGFDPDELLNNNELDIENKESAFNNTISVITINCKSSDKDAVLTSVRQALTGYESVVVSGQKV